MAAGALADVDSLRPRRNAGEDARADQAVVNDNLRAGEDFLPFDREQPRVARPRADQPDFSGFLLHLTHLRFLLKKVCENIPAPRRTPGRPAGDLSRSP